MKIYNDIKVTMDEISKDISVFAGKSIPLMWYNDNNFGDAISEYITHKLSGKHVFHVPYDTKRIHYQCTGSILPVATEKTIVWGTGFGYKEDMFISKPKRIHMVRGHYTVEMCRKLGVTDVMAVGDPCYLIDRLYQPKYTGKKYQLGIIPHYVDYKFCKEVFKNIDGVFVVDLLNKDYFETIDLINSCDKCISSSLHGIIVSHAYGVPCMHVTFSDRLLKTGIEKHPILGDGLKYLDYFSSVDISEYSPFEVVHQDQILELQDAVPLSCGNKGIIDKMLACCPFRYGTEE